MMTPKLLRSVTDAAACCLLLTVGSADDAAAAGVHTWQRWETPLASSRLYANPYGDVDLKVTFTGPTGQTLRARLLGRRSGVQDPLCLSTSREVEMANKLFRR
jgi:hypothetical protein